MKTWHDTDFGEITLRYSRTSRAIRFRLTPKGNIAVTAPVMTPVFIVKQAIRASKKDIAELLADRAHRIIYTNGQEIGKSHSLIIIESADVAKPVVTSKNRQIVAQIPKGISPNNQDVQNIIRQKVITALRAESKAYLTKRLQVLASRLGYSYSSARFSHASTRWGSCSSNGTISLNIALMKLPLELIDYVIVHELSHTAEMNHSAKFWKHVEAGDPHYKLHRRQLKAMTPEL